MAEHGHELHGELLTGFVLKDGFSVVTAAVGGADW